MDPSGKSDAKRAATRTLSGAGRARGSARLTPSGRLAAIAGALVLVAPIAVRPERLLHPSPWLLFAALIWVYASQPAERPGRLWADPKDRRSALLILLTTGASNLAATI